MRIREWLRAVGRMLRGRYVCLLEEEIARLRAENLALLNSLLGTAGVPPLRIEVKEGSAGLKPGVYTDQGGEGGRR